MLNPKNFYASVDIVVKDQGWFDLDDGIEMFCEALVKEVLTQLAFERYTEHAIVSVALVNDNLIRDLNARFRNKDAPTNVLSFPNMNLIPDSFSSLPAICELGDVIVARETIEREAKEQGKESLHHAGHMIVHGMLHLLGYTHDSDADAEPMEALERLILNAHGIPDPY